MQEASLYNVFRTIVYIVGFYYVIKFLSRIFMPILFQKVVNKAQENFQKQHEEFQNNYNNQSSTDFNTTSSKNPKATKQVGEYVDFEEIKD
ncbi:MAG: hypothetical protein QM535_16235 [Limnohabitans sp.]|nr:hypothetical protein [Limnohabitans sp.]